ncbi:BLUF domain-containing protein [Aquimarina sp. AU474]|uniref:BLUF domain-containing protein n=1 Tax=Aquimarina sp. AU474 TaxID=2108529 RepID=UPI000D6914C1|nr:BLUF domain-containing protein [Aquimarina sp. AU474]
MIKFALYISNVSIGLSNIEFNDLIIAARRYNKTHKISGILLRIDEIFLQYIEGPEKSIDILYQKIIKDHRHTSIKLLETGKIESRKYENWEMLLKKTSLKEINQILKKNTIEAHKNSIDHNMARLILEEFIS